MLTAADPVTFSQNFSTLTKGPMDIVYNFLDGAPTAKLIRRPPFLYGTTTQNPCLFRIKENGTNYTILDTFKDVPQGDLVQDVDYLYGLTDTSLYRYHLSIGDVEVLKEFTVAPTALTLYRGILYIVSADANTLASINPDGTNYKVLFRFTKASGITPTGIAVIGDQLYGTTAEGGGLFRVNLDGSNFEIFHTFKTGTGDGVSPNPGFCEVDGLIYGTTNKGGAHNRGIIYSISLDGRYQILHSFGSAGDGYLPQRGLVAWKGYLYGTTLFGGNNRSGIFYRKGLTADSEYLVLYHCGSTKTDCAVPFGNLIINTDMGTLLCCTKRGGATNGGVIANFMLPAVDAPCFNKGTKILTDRGETVIESLRVGDLVKTFNHGFRAITHIGKGSLINTPELWHTCMYIGKREGFDPLIVTGGHSFLVPSLTEAQSRAQKALWDSDNPSIDNMPLLVAPASEDFKPLYNRDVYTYYHFVLENDGDDNRRFGVYANGFLTETPSKNQYLIRGFHSKD